MSQQKADDKKSEGDLSISYDSVVTNAENLMEKKEYKLALAELEQAIIKFGGKQRLFVLAGMCLTYGNEIDFDKARQYYSIGRTNSLENSWIDYHDGNLHLFMGEFIHACELFLRVDEDQPRLLAREGLKIIATKVADGQQISAGRRGEALEPLFKVLLRCVLAGRVPETRDEPPPQEPSRHEVALKVSEEEINRQAVINQRLSESVENLAALDPKRGLILISPPKAGTHLLRNICLQFFHSVGYEPFIFDDDVEQVLKTEEASTKKFFTSHMAFSPITLGATRDFVRMLLVREPISHLIALARSVFADTSRSDYVYLQSRCSLEDMIQILCSGYCVEGVTVLPFRDFYMKYGLDWVSSSDLVVLTEDLVAAAKGDARGVVPIMKAVLAETGIDWEEDFDARILVGANPELSATFLPPLTSEELSRAQAVARYAITNAAPEILTAYRDLSSRCRGGVLKARPIRIER